MKEIAVVPYFHAGKPKPQSSRRTRKGRKERRRETRALPELGSQFGRGGFPEI